ncbi:MAG: hypothetical protein OEY28_07200 [Nitrospira sp.]|nr:hypothetical protein [Nitrospira sp.]
MGFSRHWLRDHGFVLTMVRGSINGRSLMEHVRALNQESHGISGLKELVDCRELIDVSALSVCGVTDASMSETKKPGSRLVFLLPKHSPVLYGIARAYQMFAMERRDAVMISTDFVEAVQWLGLDEKSLHTIQEVARHESCMPESIVG